MQVAPAPPIATAQPIATTVPGQPVTVAGQAIGVAVAAPMPTAIARPVAMVAQPPRQPSSRPRDVDACGFMLFDKDSINPATNLAGIFLSCCTNVDCFFGFFLPIPCLACHRFTATGQDTLVVSNLCNCCLDVRTGKQYHRNWDESQQPGPPNSFSSADGDTFEFGACNGTCAGWSSSRGDLLSGVSYLRVC